jgi:hypothetical protein
LPNENFRVEQLASIALAPNDALQQYMEDHESDIFMEERNEIDEILLRQPEMLKHNLPMEDLGTTLPPKEDPVFDLKPLPDDLKYPYIDDKKTYPVIISSKLSGKEEERLLEILRKHRGAIGYTLDDLKGISPTICQHAINMEPDAKPVCRGDDLRGMPHAELFVGWRPRSLHGSKTGRPAPPGAPAVPAAGWRFHRGRPEPGDEDKSPPTAVSPKVGWPRQERQRPRTGVTSATTKSNQSATKNPSPR